MTSDLPVRLEAFKWLSAMTDLHGEVLPRSLLAKGFRYHGQSIPLVSPQGIHKPRMLDLPLTITTTPKGPYEDRFSSDGLLIYRYRGTDPNHRDNVGLRRLFERQIPLIYFLGIVQGRYLATWPVYIVGDDPAGLAFTVAVDDIHSLDLEPAPTSRLAEKNQGRREYLTTRIRTRLHQHSFRERVLRAYRSQCAFCRLKRRELLDAAHIIPDSFSDSKATVDNGMALCKLHHAAYDRFMIGVTPDFKIVVREDILEEDDGPMLLHGLQGLHGSSLILPVSRANWPNQEALAWRMEQFKQAVFR